jgi:putative addiction module CopG family antidote
LTSAGLGQPRLDKTCAGRYFSFMTISLPPSLGNLVERLLSTGRYADEAEIVRAALRVLERQEFDEPPALEAALLEGVGSAHAPYQPEVLERIRQNARLRA